MQRFLQTMIATLALLAAPWAAAAEQKTDCGTVHLGTPTWPGVNFKTRTLEWILGELGYETKVTTAGPQILYNALSENDIDVYLGQWMPTHRELYAQFGRDGSIDIVTGNIRGGNYTIGVPKFVYENGVTSIHDLDEHKSKFGGKIYTPQKGSGGTTTTKRMIEEDFAGLGDWKVSSSSIAPMVAEARRKAEDKEWIAFLAWRPHPMNTMLDIGYLAGGTKYWGPNKGQVIVNTVVREGYGWQCRNVGQLLENFVFETAEQSLGMTYVMNDGMEDVAAGKKLIRKNPELLDRWFGRSGNYHTGGVMTASGDERARAVIAEALEM